jgi:mercuric ion transport protein
MESLKRADMTSETRIIDIGACASTLIDDLLDAGSTWCTLLLMQTATKQLWASALAAIVGSLCCVAPLVLLTLGISGAWISQLTALEPYRPIFIGVMAIFIGLAFRQLYIVPARCTPDEACANPRLQRRQRQIFWVVVAGLAALIAFPWYAPLLFS